LVSDSTERKHVEEELEKYREHLEERVTERTAELEIANKTLRQEITEPKRAEQTLKQSTEQFQTLLETAPVIICWVDLKARVLYVNKKFEEVTGYSRDEVVGKLWTTLGVISAENVRLLLRRGVEKLKGSPPRAMVLQIKRRDGELIWVSGIGEIIRERGKLVGFQVIAEDVTERKRAEEAIERAAAEWRTTFDAISDLVSIHDRNYKVLRVNKAFAAAFSLKPQEIIGRTCYKLVHGTKEPWADCPHRQTLETGEPSRKDFFEPHWGIHMEVVCSPIFNESGEVIATVHIARDVTKGKRLEQELQKKSEQLAVQNEELQLQGEELMARQRELVKKGRELAEASQAKSEFLAHMSHELRTPLNVIIGFSELMLDGVPGEVNEEQSQCLTDIENSGQYLLSLINGILDLSRIEAGKMELKLRNIDLPSIIASLKSEVLPMLVKKKHSLEVVMEEGLPLVRVDKDKIRQVLINLLSNATKFTPDGGKLKVEAARDDSWCRVSVIDNGIGIKKKNQRRIFNPFCQAKDPLVREKSGTGLGLTISQQIIENHGGRFWVESEYGKGSRFNFTLPLAAAGESSPRQEIG